MCIYDVLLRNMHKWCYPYSNTNNAVIIGSLPNKPINVYKTSAATSYNWNNTFPFAICRLVSTTIKSRRYLGVSLIIVWEINNTSQFYKLFNTFRDPYWWQSKPTKNLGCHTAHNSHLYIKTPNTLFFINIKPSRSRYLPWQLNPQENIRQLYI